MSETKSEDDLDMSSPRINSQIRARALSSAGNKAFVSSPDILSSTPGTMPWTLPILWTENLEVLELFFWGYVT